MTAAIASFISTWSPSILSTNHRIEVRNVTQGGNDLLAAVPQGLQAMWAGSVMAQVAEVTSGPIYAVAQFFRVLFHPCVSFPLSIVSCAVKERFYESSAKCNAEEQTKYFARGAQVDHSIAGTVSIVVDGQVRHFILGRDITWMIQRSTVIEKDGEMKLFLYERLPPGADLGENCREIDIEGERVRVRLSYEIEYYYAEMTVGNSKEYYSLGHEVPEPIRGSVRVDWQDYLIGDEIPAETPDCIKLHIPAQILPYDTGKEIAAPTETSRSLMIDGTLRHFASVKFVPNASVGLSGLINRIPKLPFKISTRLSHFAVQTLELVNKHMSNVIRVAMIVAGAVLLFFGHVYMAAGALLAVSYEYLDHDLGVVPRKVSFFMEKWMPAISMVGLLITGSFFSQVLAGATLLLMIPSVNLFMHQKVATVARKALLGVKDQLIEYMGRGAMPHDVGRLVELVEEQPLLEECDAPLVERKDLNAQEIGEILNANENAYELNPAHLTKNFEPVIPLPENSNFAELTRLWDEVGVRWAEPNAYNRLFKRLVDDKRFILFVKERFPEAKRFFFEEDRRLGRQGNGQRFEELQRIHRNQFDEWIQVIAREKGYASKNEFAAAWVKQQLEFYVGKVGGSRPIEGEQHLLRDATQFTAQIIPFLLKPETTQVEREDALVKLAIEGGDYCSLAMKRASKEVLQGFVEPLAAAILQPDLQKAFENEAHVTLQKERLRGIQSFYQEIVSRLQGNEEAQDTADDVHLYEAVTRSLKRGFYPLSEEDLAQFSFTELMIKETIGIPFQAELMRMYRELVGGEIRVLSIVPGNLMRNRILEYLRAWVNGNNALTPEEKGALINGALSDAPDQIANPDNHTKWSRLFQVVLGIIRKKRVEPAPIAMLEPIALPAFVSA